jgi:hypothetical protein
MPAIPLWNCEPRARHRRPRRFSWVVFLTTPQRMLFNELQTVESPMPWRALCIWMPFLHDGPSFQWAIVAGIGWALVSLIAPIDPHLSGKAEASEKLLNIFSRPKQ